MTNYKIVYPNELNHHGVKGMKWGVRKNENYSADQRKRDKGIYGSGGVRRINRSMNKGHSISSARSKEAGRIYKYRRMGTALGSVGGAVGGVGGAIAGFKVSRKVLSKYGTGDPTMDMFASGAVAMGGYNPSKFRYR